MDVSEALVISGGFPHCRNGCFDEIEDLVRETAVATLANLARSTVLDETVQSRNVTVKSTPETQAIATVIDPEDEEPSSATIGYFFALAHDNFMFELLIIIIVLTSHQKALRMIFHIQYIPLKCD